MKCYSAKAVVQFELETHDFADMQLVVQRINQKFTRLDTDICLGV